MIGGKGSPVCMVIEKKTWYMNKIFLLLLFSGLLLTRNGSGQAFDGGLLTGLTVSQIDGDTYGGYNKAGAAAGAWIRTAPGSRTRLQLELRFYMKGASPGSLTGGAVYPITRLMYVDMPILMHLQLARRLSVQCGVAGGYLANAGEDINGYGYQPTTIPFRSFELSGQAGAGFNLTEQWQMNIRFSYSLLPVRLNPGSYVRYFDKGQYNNSLAFSVYYMINRRNGR